MSLNICLPLSALLSAASPETKPAADWIVYIQIAALVFLQYAVWGAWVPVLASRLMGPLKMTGKQTSWIFATFPLASMISPLLFGQLADQGYSIEYLLAGCHLVGAAALLWNARATKFTSVFAGMFVFSFFYGATLGLVNTVIFGRLPPESAQQVFLWAPIGWAAIGYLLTGLRQLRREEGDGSDAFYIGVVVSLMLVVMCAFVIKAPTPDAPAVASAVDAAKAAAPTAVANPLVEALKMLREPYYLLFMVVSMFGAGMLQFYFLGTGSFMISMGISGKNVPGAMAIAQVCQAVATVTLLVWLTSHYGSKVTLVTGLTCWALLYAIYIIGKPRWLIVVGQSLHGIAYVLFIIAGWSFVAEVAPDAIKASANSLIMQVENGWGMFFGSLVAGFIMDRNKVGEQFQWSKIWMVPLGIVVVGAILLGTLFYPPEKPAAAGAPAALEAAK